MLEPSADMNDRHYVGGTSEGRSSHSFEFLETLEATGGQLVELCNFHIFNAADDFSQARDSSYMKFVGDDNVHVHKRLMIESCALFKIDRRKKRTPVLRATPLDVRVSLTRRCEDSAPIALDVEVLVDDLIAVLLGGIPVSTRVRLSTMTRKLQLPLSYSLTEAAWLEQAVDHANALARWEVLHQAVLGARSSHRQSGTTKAKASALSRLNSLFEEFDGDRSGFLDRQEFRTQLENHRVTLRDEDFAALWRAFDTNGDGVIDRSEFFSNFSPGSDLNLDDLDEGDDAHDIWSEFDSGATAPPAATTTTEGV